MPFAPGRIDRRLPARSARPRPRIKEAASWPSASRRSLRTRSRPRPQAGSTSTPAATRIAATAELHGIRPPPARAAAPRSAGRRWPRMRRRPMGSGTTSDPRPAATSTASPMCSTMRGTRTSGATGASLRASTSAGTAPAISSPLSSRTSTSSPGRSASAATTAVSTDRSAAAAGGATWARPRSSSWSLGRHRIGPCVPIRRGFRPPGRSRGARGADLPADLGADLHGATPGLPSRAGAP